MKQVAVGCAEKKTDLIDIGKVQLAIVFGSGSEVMSRKGQKSSTMPSYWKK